MGLSTDDASVTLRAGFAAGMVGQEELSMNCAHGQEPAERESMLA